MNGQKSEEEKDREKEKGKPESISSFLVPLIVGASAQ